MIDGSSPSGPPAAPPPAASPAASPAAPPAASPAGLPTGLPAAPSALASAPTASPASPASPAAPAAPAHATAVGATAEALTDRGIQLCRKARWRAAVEPLQQAVEADPTNATAFYHLGDAYNHTDALAAALEAFESATRLEPDHWRALKGIGIVLDRMHRPHEAAAAYQRAREAQAKTAPRPS